MATRETPVYMRPINFALDVANGRSRYSRIIPPVLLALDAVLCGLVIWKIPYTEIDWKAYMEQVSQFVSGEHDYTKIKGGTGPLVYPAAHVYTYTVLYYLTDKGKDIFLAQQVFAVLYIVTLAVVMACYWKAKVPPYVFPLLILSKRLHSIFVLRCFNDCFAVLFLWLAIYFFQRKLWTFGALAYSWGLGIKMSLLLELPAVGLILFLARGFAAAMRVNRIMVHLQILMAAPFLLKNWRGYLGRAFELSRQFFYKWTVNWRMVDEEVFLSREFAIGLLVLHVSLLVTFIVTRWLKPANKSIPELVKPLLSARSARAVLRPEAQPIVGQGLSPRYVMTTMLTANVIGLLCARSLHYQFYAYLAWATPYLLWRSGVHPVLQYALWAVQEYAWNVFPSTKVSSMLVVDVMCVTVGLVWLGAKEEFQPQSERRAAKAEAASE